MFVSATWMQALFRLMGWPYMERFGLILSITQAALQA